MVSLQSKSKFWQSPIQYDDDTRITIPPLLILKVSENPKSDSLFASLNMLTVCKGISAVLSLAQIAAISYLFGTSRIVEIFFAATFLQATVMKLSQTGRFAELFVPTFHKLEKNESRADAFLAFSVILNWASVVIFVWVALTYLLAGPLVRINVPGFSDALQADVKYTLFFVAPILFPQVLTGILRGLTWAEGAYVSTEVTAFLGRAVNIIVVLCFYHLEVWCLVLGLWLGSLATFLALLILVFRLGFRYQFSLSSDSFQIGTFLKSFPAMLSSTGATQPVSYTHLTLPTKA